VNGDLADIIREHPAVAEALVTAGTDGEEPTAWCVPDPETATMLHRSTVVEEEGRLGVLSWHEPADGFRVAGLNRGETDFLYREIFVDGAYLRRGGTLPPKAVVVDVGANIGMFTLRAAACSPGARVIAVEPAAEVAEAVRINAYLHGVDAVVACAAVGSAESESEFTFYRHNSVMSGRFADETEDSSVLKGYLLTGDGSADTAQLDRLVAGRLTPQRRRVPVTTLASLASAHRLDRIDLLKIDVEKAEWEALAGIGERLWPRIDRIVMEVHDTGGRLNAVVGLLREKGFAVETDQDPRLVLTPCHSVYAYRPQLASSPAAAPVLAVPAGGPTMRELERDLRRLIAERRPSAEAPRRFAVVRDLAFIPGRTSAATIAHPEPRATRRTAALAVAWSALFGAEQVRPEADFFELGGTSLLALRLLDLVEQEIGAGVLTPELIFATSTLGELAALVQEAAPPESEVVGS
jgi:FkbM family methyltransferase